MKYILLKTISYVALIGTILPSLLVFFGDMNIEVNKTIMTISMIVWFLTAPFWINKSKTADETS